MERRKFIAGLGSLTAAGAAGIGTGAFTNMEATRAVDAAVVNDASGFLSLSLSHSSLENEEYASYENGSLELHFNSSANNSGDGLNPDSTFEFDNVFQILNQTSEDGLKIDIDKSGLDNPNSFTFYAHQTNGSLIGSRTSDWNGQISSGFGVNIGVRIETPDSLSSSWETGKIVISATDSGDQNTS